jgi:hypothetical protein
MLYPLLIMAVATKFFYGANLLTRTRVKLLEQDIRKSWVKKVVKEQKS